MLDTTKTSQGYGNTGNPITPLDLEFVSAIAFVPATKVFTAAECIDGTTFMTTLKAMVTLPYNQRAFIINNLVDNKDVSEKPSTGSFGNKWKFTLHEGYYILEFGHNKGIKFHQQLRKFNGQQNRYKCILFGKNYSFGTQRLDATGVSGHGGFSMFEIQSDPFIKGDGFGKLADYTLKVSFKNISEFNDKPSTVLLNDANGFAIDTSEELKGLKGVTLKVVGAPAATYCDVQVLSTLDGENLYDYANYYNNASVLAKKELWTVAKTSDLSTTYTVSGAVAQPATKSFRITFASATGLNVTIALADAATLKTQVITAVAGTDVRDGMFIEADGVVTQLLP